MQMSTTFQAIELPAFAGNPLLQRPQPAQNLPTWPSFDDGDIEATSAILRSGRVNYWTGEHGKLFEREFANFCHCRYAVALANGTVALEAALKALNIGPGDQVITTSRTFIASASAVVAVGAQPVVAEVDRDSQNLTAETIAAQITPRTRAIIAVHLAGWPCDMEPILSLAHAHGLSVIEDCAQAHGALYKGKPVGSLGDIAAFSFCQDKIMTTAGEGGMITTNSEDLWRRVWSYKDHGKDYDAVHSPHHRPGFRWLHHSFGTNWRLSEVQSAIGRRALLKLSAWLSARKRNAAALHRHFADLPGLRLVAPSADISHAFYKYYAFVELDALKHGWNRDRIAAEIVALGVPCGSGSCSEIYLEGAFPQQWRPSSPFPVARELGETSLMFQVHPTLQPQHMEHVADVVTWVMHQAVR